MYDALTDGRAQALEAADPNEVHDLAGSLSKVASQAQTVATALRGAHGDADWTGGAADKFRQHLGELPDDLSKIHESYGDAAGALRTYGSALEPIKAQWNRLVGQIDTAQQAVTTTQGQVSGAKTKAAQHTATTAVTRAQGNLQGLQTQAGRVLDAFDGIRHTAVSAVSKASGIAPEEHHSWLSSAVHAVGNFVAGVGKGIWNSIKDLPAAAANLYHHPFSAEAWGRFSKDLAVTASVIALVAAPFAAPELLAADAETGLGVEALGEEGLAGEGGSALGTTARVVNTWGGRVSTVATGSSSISDAAQGKWGAAGVDAAFTILPNVGAMPHSIDSVQGVGDRLINFTSLGDKAAQSATTTYVNDARALGWTRYGLNSTAAAQLEDAPSVGGLTHLGVQSTTQAARGQALATAGRALHLGKPAAGLIDKVIVEPGKDKLSELASPEPEGACAGG